MPVLALGAIVDSGKNEVVVRWVPGVAGCCGLESMSD